MDKEMRKRLEEAAEEYIESQDYMELENEFLMDEEGTCITRIYRDKQVEDSFLAGAEHGYKVAIAICNDVIVDVANEFFGDYAQSCGLANKVLDKMNKLWEE